MKIAVILNGISPKKKNFYQSILPALKDKFRVEVFETLFANHAHQLAEEATKNGFDFILSAGGDGTLNQVLNGIMSVANKNQMPTLGLIPLGSGNDFANTVGSKANADSLIELLETNKPLPTDIGRITCRSSEGQTELH